MSYQILIVDDDREFRQELSECLQGYRVKEAQSGEEALTILKKPHAIDLVILDIIMPQHSGLETLKAIKAIDPQMTIVMLTGQSTKDSAIQALKGHADDYIEKPFDVARLLATVQRLLESKQKNILAHLSKMEKVKQYLQRNLDKKIGLKDLSQEINLSPKYISRLFKERVGIGLSDFRLKIRMDKAEELLGSSGSSIEDISRQLGYRNPESFIRMFEKMYKRTPTQYRTRLLKKKAGKRVK
jgi:YesN/AraC family two-component response regulator